MTQVYEEPKIWEVGFRLNTCVQENCQHYLWAHGPDGKCMVKDCQCQKPIGREYKKSKS
jgi:hypothetical protein